MYLLFAFCVLGSCWLSTSRAFPHARPRTRAGRRAESAGRWLVKVNARGTSQQCPCGRAVPKQLWDRKHHCSACGFKTIRDHASALEILRRGLRLRTETPALAGVALEAPSFSYGA
ncbi:MAG: hypothetical protein DMG69_28455 [Acidobacteria bacterium]|nr:MAG: hypothetical protein DMG69_28455 [Acidobacteriota bacterium]